MSSSSAGVTPGRSPQGRRYDTGPTVAVAAGEFRCAWNGGVFAGDRPLVEWAQGVADSRVEVEVFGRRVTAGADTPLGAVAAIASWAPGRALVVAAPDEVLEALSSRHLPPATSTDPGDATGDGAPAPATPGSRE